MLFPVCDAIPTGSDREPGLEKILDWADEAHGTPVPEVLSGFFGQPLDARTLRVTALHHVALYIGDYDKEEDFEAWLEQVRSSPRTDQVATGPSHIAPREYGTPGHWINLRTARGHEVELFTCRRRGEWAGRGAEQKTTLMSHFGVAVDTPGHVRPLLDYLASFEGVELLAYAPADELGHTYGHVIRGDTDRVLELVHAGAQPGGSR